MSTQTVSQAVAKQADTPAALIERYEAAFADILPSHLEVGTWIRVAQGAFRRNPKLYEAAVSDPDSLMVALQEAARLGLEPGTKQYYLTPRKNKGRPSVLGIVGYQGEVELIYRAGAVSSVVIEVVRSGDRFSFVLGRDERPVHEVDWFGDRGELIGVYAYAIMRDGATSKVVVLNRAHINRAKASSAGADTADSPWKTDEEAMWLKTAARRLGKWVPTSSEYTRERLRIAAEVAQERRESQAASTQVPTPTLAASPTDATPTGVNVVTGELALDDGPSGRELRDAAAAQAQSEVEDLPWPES